MEVCRKILVSGLQTLNMALSKQQIDQLLDFIKLIEKWNKAYNLTAIHGKEDMVRLHLLDSLAIAPFIEGKRVIDIGTGAGLPGIPLAICLPETKFTLLDSNAKKTRFVQQAILELKLKNSVVYHQRVENYKSEQTFDTVITRAFASLSDIVKLTAHLLGKNGILLAMKGQNPEAELAQIAEIARVIPVQVPGCEAERCLVRISATDNTDLNKLADNNMSMQKII
ncbi:MAG: 16S rRNA (guanine(527)-N(7))-methyltransferase RsmG [Methylococcales bacterium]|nr:16S rRNA (guanine(527)-N(7))-methyltransferase RsmG [Methylococcales bacterium]